MRIPIAMMLAATVALSPAPLMAQAYNDTTTANTAAPAPEADANTAAAVPPADANMAMPTDVAPVDDTAMANAAAPATDNRRKGFPWGVLGLLGLVGLLGRRRADR